MAIQVVQRPVTSPVPPLVEGKMAEALTKWLPKVPLQLLTNRVDTQLTVQAASGVSTPILTLPTSFGLWLVTVAIGRVADAVNYQAAAIVFCDGASARMVNVLNAPSQTITLAGLTVSSTQVSGSAQNMVATALQLTNF